MTAEPFHTALYTVIGKGIEIITKNEFTNIIRTCYVINRNTIESQAGGKPTLLGNPTNREW